MYLRIIVKLVRRIDKFAWFVLWYAGSLVIFVDDFVYLLLVELGSLSVCYVIKSLECRTVKIIVRDFSLL